MLSTGVGIEIEVENVPILENLDQFRWEIKKDASLRNNGKEFVTKFGSRLYDVENNINYLFDLFSEINRKTKGNFFQFTERTSIHVHIDVRKLSFKEIKSLIILYTLFEDSLFKLAGEQRKHNVFCVPLRYVGMSFLTGQSFKVVLSRWEKYCAMNLCRMFDFGTVEFRHMEGNNDKERIINWVFTLAKLVDYCRITPLEDIEEEVRQLKYLSHYSMFSNKVFGSEIAKTIEIISQDFDQAVSDAKFFFTIKV